MKKFVAVLLCLVMVLAVVACGKKAAAPVSANPADAIPDEMTSSDGKYTIAFG